MLNVLDLYLHDFTTTPSKVVESYIGVEKNPEKYGTVSKRLVFFKFRKKQCKFQLQYFQKKRIKPKQLFF